MPLSEENIQKCSMIQAENTRWQWSTLSRLSSIIPSVGHFSTKNKEFYSNGMDVKQTLATGASDIKRKLTVTHTCCKLGGFLQDLGFPNKVMMCKSPHWVTSAATKKTTSFMNTFMKTNGKKPFRMDSGEQFPITSSYYTDLEQGCFFGRMIGCLEESSSDSGFHLFVGKSGEISMDGFLGFMIHHWRSFAQQFMESVRNQPNNCRQTKKVSIADLTNVYICIYI